MKVYLVDGTYELFRAHFGQPERLAPDGMHVSAVRGLIMTLISLLNQPEVTHIAVAFDSSIKSFRNELLPTYKDGSDTPLELKMQFPLAERVVNALGIVSWPMHDYEADDALATAALLYSKQDTVQQVIICSPDKDLCQMVSGDQIVCLDRKNNLVLNELGVLEKFGILPISIPDYLGLVGDTADNIPGIPKWGAKSSSTLLNRYIHIEDIPNTYELWDVSVRGAAALSLSLEDSREEACLYREIATVRTDLEITETLKELEWLGASKNLFPSLCRELGLGNLSNRPQKWQ